MLDQALGKGKRQGVPHLKGWGKIHLRALFGDGLLDFGATMAGVDTPEPGGGIKNLAPLIIPIKHAQRAFQKAGGGLELPIRGKGHPEGVEIRRSFHGGW